MVTVSGSTDDSWEVLTRYAALGLSVVNVIAVVGYAHVLMSDGFEAALGQHYLWGLMLLTLLVFGPGRLSADGFVGGERSVGR